MALERLYPIPEAAVAMGGISERTVEAWLSKGLLGRTKIGRRTFISESELKRFIKIGNTSPENARGEVVARG